MLRRAFLIFVLAFSAFAQDPQETIWKEYLAFTGGQDGPEQVAKYRAKLLAGGMTEPQSWDRVFLIDKLRQKFQQTRWTTGYNRLYSAPEQPYFTEAPNAFLASVIAGLKPGAALDVSMGQGRNTVFLATKGWQATGFDPAEEGLKVAQAAADKAGVKITTVKAGHEDFDFGKERWDLIVFCYSFAPLTDAQFIQRVHASLKPGGMVLIEHPMNNPETAMHPQDVINSLPQAYARGFRIVFYEDTIGLSDWQQAQAKRTEDPRRMVRFLARKYPAK